MRQANLKSLLLAIVLATAVSTFQSCQQSGASVGASTENIESLKKIAMQFVESNDSTASHIKTFDALDFDVFSNQKWDRFKESHAQNIKVFGQTVMLQKDLINILKT